MTPTKHSEKHSPKLIECADRCFDDIKLLGHLTTETAKAYRVARQAAIDQAHTHHAALEALEAIIKCNDYADENGVLTFEFKAALVQAAAAIALMKGNQQ